MLFDVFRVCALKSADEVVNRRWFRFRLRTLFILLTVVCLYFACWLPTKTRGVADVRKHFGGAPVPKVPLVLTTRMFEVRNQPPKPRQLIMETQYYFWFFGLVVKVPITTEQAKDITLPADWASSNGITNGIMRGLWGHPSWRESLSASGTAIFTIDQRRWLSRLISFDSEDGCPR